MPKKKAPKKTVKKAPAKQRPPMPERRRMVSENQRPDPPPAGSPRWRGIDSLIEE